MADAEQVRDFAVYGEGGETLMFGVRPRRACGYGRGERFSATRWRFLDNRPGG